MAGPWEKYATPAPAMAGPWAKYAAQPQPEPAVPAAPVQDTSFRADIPGTPQTPQRAAEIQQARDINAGSNGPAYVAQQTSRSVADVAGMPVDLAGAGLNALLAGIGTDARIEQPFMGSDWIASKASQVGDMLGTETVEPDQVSKGYRLAGDMGRAGGNAALTGGMLASGPAQGAKGVVGALAKPYAADPMATLARDTAAGMGAGAGSFAYDEAAPQSVQESTFGPLLKAAASIFGGVGGYGLASVAEGTTKGLAKTVQNAFMGAGDPNSPINPDTGQPFTRTQMDNAARVAQKMPTSKAQTIANIDQGVKEFGDFAAPSQMPTTGMLSDDIGMAIQENILRSKDPQRFLERDAARRSLASDKVNATAPANADPRTFVNEATKQYDDTLNAARQNVDDAAARQTAAGADIQRQNTTLNEMAVRQPEASAKLDATFRGSLDQARAEKNALYDAVPDTTPVSGEDILGQLDAIDQSVPRAAKGGTDYGTVSGRLRSLLQDTDPTTGETIARDITYGDVKVLRADINAMRREAVAAGKDVSYLDQVGRVLSEQMDTLNPEAAANYRDNFAPKFKTGKVGEYESQLKRAARTGEESSGTRPSEFGGKFLKKPEDAAALNRAIDVNGNPVTAETAGDWMMGDLAKSGVLTDNAELRFDKFRQWSERNKGTIDQFPAIRKRIDAELATAQKGGMLSKQLASEVDAAKANMKTTEDTLRRSALQSAIGNNPENTIASIMGSGDPEKQMSEMVSRLAGNQDATDGMKGAVRDWIKQKAGTTSKVVGDPDATRLSRANLEKLFNQHEKTLAKIYSPDEMNALRQAQKLMGAEASLDVRATAGSNTLDKMNMASKADMDSRKRVLEAGLKARYGVLKGGGMFRTFSLFLQALPDPNRGLGDILFEMQFNPELAKHLLTRPVKDVSTPAWNSKLNKLLGAATGARESTEGKP